MRFKRSRRHATPPALSPSESARFEPGKEDDVSGAPSRSAIGNATEPDESGAVSEASAGSKPLTHPAVVSGDQVGDAPETLKFAELDVPDPEPANTDIGPTSGDRDHVAPANPDTEYPRMALPQRSRLGILATCSLLALALAGVLLAQTTGGKTILRHAGLYQQPTPFVELYFLHPQRLPIAAIRPRPRQDVSFVIRNEQHEPGTYSWTIATKGSAAAATGHVMLRVGKQAMISRLVRVNCSASRAYVQVTLLAPRETIGYWDSCRALTSSVRASRIARRQPPAVPQTHRSAAISTPRPSSRR
jgi:hypothetical protein